MIWAQPITEFVMMIASVALLIKIIGWESRNGRDKTNLAMGTTGLWITSPFFLYHAHKHRKICQVINHCHKREFIV